jgi:hypothetical protein
VEVLELETVAARHEHVRAADVGSEQLPQRRNDRAQNVRRAIIDRRERMLDDAHVACVSLRKPPHAIDHRISRHAMSSCPIDARALADPRSDDGHTRKRAIHCFFASGARGL